MNEVSFPDYDSGVYVLASGEKVKYVGQSSHMWLRLATHRKNHGESIDRAFVIPCSPEEMDELEEALIKHFQADWNRNKRGFMHAPNTGSRFGLSPVMSRYYHHIPWHLKTN